jgi:hypothetical protein
LLPFCLPFLGGNRLSIGSSTKAERAAAKAIAVLRNLAEAHAFAIASRRLIDRLRHESYEKS